jgi:hypothetical protein
MHFLVITCVKQKGRFRAETDRDGLVLDGFIFLGHDVVPLIVWLKIMVLIRTHYAWRRAA